MNIGAGIGIGFAEPRGVLAFEYEQSSGCQNGSDITPLINTPGGTFSSSPAGLSINSSTGVIDVSASTAGTYTVTYSIGPTEDTITIEAADDATFAYSASSFPQDGSNPIPTITGLTGGTFSAGSGLVFVDSGSNTGSSTGQINLSASTIASYTVTYTTSGSCPNTSTQTVEVASALAQVNNVYSMEFDGINDYIDLGNSDDLSFSTNTTNDLPFSISSWVKPDNTSKFRVIRKAPFNTGAGYEYIFSTNSNRNLNFLIYDNNNNRIGTSTSAAITSTDWQHWVVTYDGTGKVTGTNSGMKTYINGFEVTTGSANIGNYTGMTKGSFKSIIGLSWGSSGFSYADGKIDELAIFNVELTAQEVQSIYNATETGKTADLNDLTTPPIKWYRMGD